MKEKYGINVDTIFIEDIMIYDTFLEIKRNKDLKIEAVYADCTGNPIPDKKKFLTINFVAKIPEAKINGKDYKNVDVLSPLINYRFRDN